MLDKIFALCEYDINHSSHNCIRCPRTAVHKLRLYIKPRIRHDSLSFNGYFCDECFKHFKDAMLTSDNRTWYIKIELKELAFENKLDFEVKLK